MKNNNSKQLQYAASTVVNGERINIELNIGSKDEELNKYTPEDDRPVPFRNMIYIGDGLTDVPCMKLVKANGGYSIAVYTKGKRSNVESLIEHERVDFISLADYSEGSDLDITVKDILCKMAMVDSLKSRTKNQLKSIAKK